MLDPEVIAQQLIDVGCPEDVARTLADSLCLEKVDLKAGVYNSLPMPVVRAFYAWLRDSQEIVW
jgi:hypothetical protein